MSLNLINVKQDHLLTITIVVVALLLFGRAFIPIKYMVTTLLEMKVPPFWH